MKKLETLEKVFFGSIFVILLIGFIGIFVASPANASAIVGHSGLEDNLEGCWDLEESSSSTRLDATANDNDLDDVNDVQQADGHILKGADFEDAGNPDESLKIVDNASLSVTTAFTISVWFKLEAGFGAGNYCPVGKWTTAGNLRSYYLCTQGTANVLNLAISTAGTDATQQFHSPTITNDSNFRHIVWVNDGTNSSSTAYIDNVGTGTDGTMGSPQDNGSAFYLGATHDGVEQSFDGITDITAIWSRLLTGAEVATLYNSGTGIPCTAAAAAEPEPQQGEIWFHTTYHIDLREYEYIKKV